MLERMMTITPTDECSWNDLTNSTDCNERNCARDWTRQAQTYPSLVLLPLVREFGHEAYRIQVNRPARPGAKRRRWTVRFTAELGTTVESKQQLVMRECCPDHSKLVARPRWY